MNIVEAYIKFNEGLIILISGLSGSGKTKLMSDIERDFKIQSVNIENFCIKENNKTVTLPNDVTVTDWDHIDSYDWDKINKTISDKKSKGIVVCGPYFPTDKLQFKSDFHINIKISKQQLIQRRHDYIKNNPDKCKNLVKFLDTPVETLIINKITYPHFLEYSEKSKVDKFINAHELNADQIYDQASDFLFNKVQSFLNDHDKKLKRSAPTLNLDSSKDTDQIIDESDEMEDSSNIFLGTEYDEIEELNYLPETQIP